MNIKSLLLGSAAVLVAVSGARAADAIVVEAEPVEYVRICDAYGSGWFFIPGTETCLKMDGNVRVIYTSAHYHDDKQDETSSHDATYRAELNFRANNETEYGTLASRIRFRADGGEGGHDDVLSASEGPGDAGAIVNIAQISLAGFRAGYSNNYWTIAGNYGFYSAEQDGSYGFNSGLYFDYTYTANGFSATIGVEDGDASGEAGAPDLYAGLTYSGNNWYLAGIVYNDSSVGDVAYRLRADYDFGNGFNLGGWWNADNGNTDYVKGHSYGVTASYRLSETMLLFAGYGEYADQYDCPAAQAGNTCAAVSEGEDESFSTMTVGLTWDVVPGLQVIPEYSKTWFNDEVAGTRENAGVFLLKVERSF